MKKLYIGDEVKSRYRDNISIIINTTDKETILITNVFSGRIYTYVYITKYLNLFFDYIEC